MERAMFIRLKLMIKLKHFISLNNEPERYYIRQLNTCLKRNP